LNPPVGELLTNHRQTKRALSPNAFILTVCDAIPEMNKGVEVVAKAAVVVLKEESKLLLQ
jgi:hypothetical protein